MKWERLAIPLALADGGEPYGEYINRKSQDRIGNNRRTDIKIMVNKPRQARICSYSNLDIISEKLVMR